MLNSLHVCLYLSEAICGLFLPFSPRCVFCSLPESCCMQRGFHSSVVKNTRQLTDSLEYKPLIGKACYSCHSLKTTLLVLHIIKTQALSAIHRGLCRWIIYPVANTDTGILLVLFLLSITGAHHYSQQICSLQLWKVLDTGSRIHI